MRFAKALGAAGALITAAIVGGTLIGSTLAVDETDGTDTTGTQRPDVAAYCETFMDTLAGELGTTRDGLIAAGKTAANAALDAAVAAGDLTEEQATRMRDHIAEFDGDGCALLGRGGFGGFGGRGPGDGDGPRGDGGPGRHFRGFLDSETFGAAAAALGLEASALPSAVAQAGSLEALAATQGVAYDDVKAAILAAVQADLDAAVAAGDLTQERADSVLERATTWLDEGGELPGRWGGRHDADDEDDAGA